MSRYSKLVKALVIYDMQKVGVAKKKKSLIYVLFSLFLRRATISMKILLRSVFVAESTNAGTFHSLNTIHQYTDTTSMEKMVFRHNCILLTKYK